MEFSTLTLEAIDLARALFADSAQLLVFGAVEANDGAPEPITGYQLNARLSSLGVRGTGYAEHLERVILGCFAPLDELCKRVLGFTAQDALDIHAGVAALVESRVNERASQAPEYHAEMIRELKRARKQGTSEILPTWLLELPPKEAKTHIGAMVTSWIFIDARALGVFTAGEVAGITGLPPDVVESFLEGFACDPDEFVEEHHALPSGAHPLTTMPVLKVGDGFLIPAPHTMLDTIRPRMEDLLHGDRSAWERYVRHRGRFVEEEAKKLLASAFPGSSSWAGLGWRSEDDESDLDALVDSGDMALRVQCKSGRITAPVRRGAPKRMITELDELIGEAADQHARLARALQDTAATDLGFSEDATRALSQPLQLEVIVTLDEVTTWATQAHELQSLEVLPADRTVPWILSLTDLMAVVDLLESASLAHYLVRRQRLERDRRIEAHDELDWVGHYIAEGLFFDPYFEGEEAPTRFRLLSYTEPIDAWYFTRQGDRTENPASKPSQNIPDPLALLLRRLAEERPVHWLIASIALLDGDDESRNLWADGVVRIRSRVRSEGWSNTTQVFNDLIGVTVYVDHRAHPAGVRRAAREYALEKAAEHGLENWIVVGEGPDHELFVVLHAEQGIPAILECFLAPQRQRLEPLGAQEL